MSLELLLELLSADVFEHLSHQIHGSLQSLHLELQILVLVAILYELSFDSLKLVRHLFELFLLVMISLLIMLMALSSLYLSERH